MCWTTDGANQHKKKKKLFWPFMFVINQSKKKHKRSFLILFTLYYEYTKNTKSETFYGLEHD